MNQKMKVEAEQKAERIALIFGWLIALGLMLVLGRWLITSVTRSIDASVKNYQKYYITIDGKELEGVLK